MSGLGKALELGITHAAKSYRKEGRGVLMRQYPRMAYRDGGMRYASTAPLDFIGAHKGGRGLAIEAKETHELALDLGEKGLDEDQRTACEIMHRLGVDVHVIVDVMAEREVYDLPWLPIAEFLAAPWRRSLSLQWMRAYGLLLPEQNRDSETSRRVLFLDGKTHPAYETAYLAVAAERAITAVIDLGDNCEGIRKPSKDSDAFAALMARKPRRDDEAAYRHWLDDYSKWELEHLHKRAKKLRGRRQWGRR